jgi:hypothetical protein
MFICQFPLRNARAEIQGDFHEFWRFHYFPGLRAGLFTVAELKKSRLFYQAAQTHY